MAGSTQGTEAFTLFLPFGPLRKCWSSSSAQMLIVPRTINVRMGPLCRSLLQSQGRLTTLKKTDNVYCPGVSKSLRHGLSSGRNDQGHFRTKRLQTYSTEYARAIASCIYATAVRLSKTGEGPAAGHRSGLMSVAMEPLAVMQHLDEDWIVVTQFVSSSFSRPCNIVMAPPREFEAA